jgi:ABC-2 type transport system permease protein
MTTKGGLMRGLWRLTWLELKIFVREPMGLVGSVVIPVVTFVVLARLLAPRMDAMPQAVSSFGQKLPAFSALLIALNAVVSLVTIVSIYREGGILRRLCATPLRPHTILTAHVVVKLLITAVTLVALALAGKRYYPVGANVPLFSFAVAVLFATWSILSIGFVIASVVPMARFAQPLAGIILYPMIAGFGLVLSDRRAPAAVGRGREGAPADSRCVARERDLAPRGLGRPRR